MFSYTSTKEQSFSLFMCFRIFNFGQVKVIFSRDEKFKELLYCKSKCLYIYINLIKTDNYFTTNCFLVINLKQNRFEIKTKYHMSYNIRYLAIYIGNLKVCNVRYILSYKLQNMKLYTRNAVKYSFLLWCIDRMLNYGLKSQQMVLHTNLQVKWL